MPFFLERGGENQILEVQRLQYFLTKQGFPEVGRVDGRFGQNTELAVKAFQTSHNLTVTGRLDEPTLNRAAQVGYTVVADDHYEKRKGDWPAKEDDLSSPTNGWRNDNLGCFHFHQLAFQHRGDPDEIVIGGSCDGTISDWEAQNIGRVPLPGCVALKSMRVHDLAAERLTALFEAWNQADLMHLIISFAGAYNPRYKRGRSEDSAHGTKSSRDVTALSNHAFGSAFDINSRQNPYGGHPAEVHQAGCVRELVPLAHEHGFFWGGYFGKRDGMHFELART